MMMESGKFKNNGNCTDIVLSATRLDLNKVYWGQG